MNDIGGYMRERTPTDEIEAICDACDELEKIAKALEHRDPERSLMLLKEIERVFVALHRLSCMGVA